MAYSFNVNHKNEYSLHRTAPYSFFKGKIATAREVIDLVKSDLARFKNAANSTNFAEFIETINEIHAIGEDMDHMFLHFNVDKEALSAIRDDLNRRRQAAFSSSSSVRSATSAMPVYR